MCAVDGVSRVGQGRAAELANGVGGGRRPVVHLNKVVITGSGRLGLEASK